jgi:hypothetical protein
MVADGDRGELGDWKTPYSNSLMVGRSSVRVHAQTEVDWLLNLRDPDMRRTTFRANKQVCDISALLLRSAVFLIFRISCFVPFYVSQYQLLRLKERRM